MCVLCCVVGDAWCCVLCVIKTEVQYFENQDFRDNNANRQKMIHNAYVPGKNEELNVSNVFSMQSKFFDMSG